MFLTVLVPTYRRPKDLTRCLDKLNKQSRPADEIIVVVRDSDTESWTLFSTLRFESLPLRIIEVELQGVVAAMNLGLNAARGDIIAITDDDAAPHSNWLQLIETYYLSDENLGAIGGRDFLYLGSEICDASTHPGASQVVGKLRWFGNVTGNHHIGEGKPREVDVLKGVNSSYRRTAIEDIGFDERLKGAGAQVHWELSLCLQLRRSGWRLIYDPEIAVDHYLGQRFDEDQRVFKFNTQALTNAVHNETLILLEHFNSAQRIVYIVWAILVGTRQAFGIVQWLRFFPAERKLASQKLSSSFLGRWQGWQTWRQGNRALLASSCLSN